MHWETVWQFSTANFRVALEIAPEDMDPVDSFSEAEDVEAVRSGKWEWFCAKVAIYGPTGDELASDYLGACAYEQVSDFYEEHRKYATERRAAKAQGVCMGSYFPDMVRQAIAGARSEWQRQQSLLATVKLHA
jgi:hypothetical protein